MCLCCADCQDGQSCGALESTGASPTLLYSRWLAVHVLGLFVPMCMKEWEGGFEKRGSKHVLNVARLFPGTRKLFSSKAVILLYDLVFEMYFMTITWGVSALDAAQCAEPRWIQRQLVHLCCRAWSWARKRLRPRGSKRLLGYLLLLM